jgi:YVTN family beta-propeller protein
MLAFSVLGPVRATADGHEIPLGGVKQRSLLALLLLEAPATVSTDRLIDALWGETPPTDAATALQAHVSRLRKALAPHDVIVTRPPGYAAEVGSATLDAQQFTALAAEGRHAEALALWTGPALADVSHEPWAPPYAERLSEQRLAVLESRLEADLAAGRDVTAELTGLVGEHPFRERLRELLMLGLYRQGRQAEALAGYDAFRRRLDDELGLEPGPELRALQERILRHDPELGGGPRRTLAVRRRRGPLLAGVALVTAAAVAGVLLLDGDDKAPVARGSGGVLVSLDPKTGAPGDRTAVGTTPAAVALGAGAAWVVDADGQTVSRVGDDGSVDTFATGTTPTSVAVGADAVWVGAGERSRTGQAEGPVTTGLVRVDPGSRTVRARIDLPAGRTHARPGLDAIAVSGDAVWAVAPDGGVVQVRGDAVTAARGPRALAVAAGGDAVWVLGEGGEVGRIDPAARRVTDPVKLPASSLSSLAVDGETAWATAPADGTLWRVDAGTPPSTRTIEVGVGAASVAVGAGAVWVANPLAGTVLRVDPATNRVTRTIRLGGTPRDVAADDDRVVVAVSGDAPAAAAADGGLPRSVCGPLLTAGGARPDRIVVSDLPLQGGVRISAQQMVQAAELVLREHRFRAGRLTLGFQSCDDSVGRTGIFDEAKCAANARLYAANPAVIGVVGQLNSPCTAAALPIANRASLAVVGSLTSAIPLTRGSPAELRRLYPTGKRTFARVFGGDDHQSQALAALAAELGARRVATIDDGDPVYGRLLARAFTDAARARGLEPVAGAHWRPAAPRSRGVTVRLARRHPDAVLVSGLLDNGGADVIRVLRAALGPRVPLLLVDGLTPTPLLVRGAGEAARGAYLAINGLTPEGYAPAGRRFAARLAATLPGAEIEPSALYAAAATEVLLDAIARSGDRTRAQVAAAVLETDLQTVIGRVRFTADGDPVGAPVTILRLRPGARTGIFEDAVLDRVVRP